MHDNWPVQTKFICAFYMFLFVLLIMMCRSVMAETYGTIEVTPSNDEQYSTNLSNNVSDVVGKYLQVMQFIYPKILYTFPQG